MGESELLEKETTGPKELKRGPKRLPDTRDYHIVDGFAEKSIGRTNRPHVCFLCRKEIAAGSKAISSAPVANNKVLVNETRYKHWPGECIGSRVE